MRVVRTALILLLGLAFFSPAALAKGDKKEKTVNDEAIEFAKEFKKTHRKIPETEVTAGLDKLVEYYKKKEIAEDKRTRKEILVAVAAVASDKRGGVVAYMVRKCADLGEDTVGLVVAVLQRELRRKPAVQNEDVWEGAFETLGKLASPKAVKPLTKLLQYRESAVVARAARAIAGYAKSPGKIRKMLFEEVLKASEGTYSGAQNSNQTQERKWNVIGDDVVEALNKLSIPPRAPQLKIENPVDARSWFSKNRKVSWDKK